MPLALYTLDENQRTRLLCSRATDREGLLAWAGWMAQAHKSGRLRIAVDRVQDVEVSTVFLGINVSVAPNRKPLLFETMTFKDGGEATVIGRSATAEEARALHAHALDTVRAAQRRG